METKSSKWWAMEAPPTKPWWRKHIIAIIVITAIIISLGVITYDGEKEPVVSIVNNHVQIACRHGLDVDLHDIARISLIEKSMKDIGFGISVGGYGVFGRALKGNFESRQSQGDSFLLFVQSGSSPTILIERGGFHQKDIYISFRDGKKTEMLYNEIKAAVKK